MAKKRTRTRVSSKIDELPEELRVKVDVMLADTSNTYEYISQYLKQEGYEISKSSVGRYAMRSNTATQRLLEAQAQTEQLIRVVKDNPDADYTEAAIMLTMNGLVNKVATAEEEFQEMPLDKAGRLIASLSRTKVYKDRVRQDMQNVDKAGVMNAIAEGLRTSTVERFRSEESPDGHKWEPSIRAQQKGGKTLTKTTALKTSIKSQADESGLAVGTNLVYAATHQYGDERTIRAKNSKYLRFQIGDRWVSVPSVRVNIPARPFLGISEQDNREIQDILEEIFEE